MRRSNLIQRHSTNQVLLDLRKSSEITISKLPLIRDEVKNNNFHFVKNSLLDKCLLLLLIGMANAQDHYYYAMKYWIQPNNQTFTSRTRFKIKISGNTTPFQPADTVVSAFNQGKCNLTVLPENMTKDDLEWLDYEDGYIKLLSTMRGYVSGADAEDCMKQFINQTLSSKPNDSNKTVEIVAGVLAGFAFLLLFVLAARYLLAKAMNRQNSPRYFANVEAQPQIQVGASSDQEMGVISDKGGHDKRDYLELRP